MEYINQILNGDCLNVLKQLPDEIIDCVVTSPPYWKLRDYGVDEQIGMEETVDDFVNKLCDIFDEIKRVMKNDGTVWVVIGDTYMNNSSYCNTGRVGYSGKTGMIYKKSDDIALKSLCMVPSRFAIEMIKRKWVLRNEIIWHKPNALPCSVKDRFTVDFEKVYFFTKISKHYYFKQQLEPLKDITILRDRYTRETKLGKTAKQTEYAVNHFGHDPKSNPEGRNKRCVWNVGVGSFEGEHYASYPEDLIEPMIKAGCPVQGVVLDPFMGSGTTGIMAKKLNRNFVGIELNEEYCKVARERIKRTGCQFDMFEEYDEGTHYDYTGEQNNK